MECRANKTPALSRRRKVAHHAGKKEPLVLSLIHIFLNFMSQCRNSLPNQLLLSGQNADITDARTFQQWKDAGRHIRTGEEGYTAIVGQVYENNGRKASGYNIGKVFDITQTRGRPIPPPAEYQVDELIAATIESSPRCV